MGEATAEILNKVRNNLFHGSRVYDDSNDCALLDLVTPILLTIVTSSEQLRSLPLQFQQQRPEWGVVWATTPTYFQVFDEYETGVEAIPDPTSLIEVYEADRLTTNSLEQLRSVFDRNDSVSLKAQCVGCL